MRTGSATGSALLDRTLSLAEVLDRRGLVLRSDLLRAWAHWITPEFEPRRFDTRFFVAPCRPGQRPRDLSGEADQAGLGADPRGGRAARGRRRCAMLPPTIVVLRDARGLRHRRGGARRGRHGTPLMPRARCATGAATRWSDGPAASALRAVVRGTSDRRWPSGRRPGALVRRQPRPDDPGRAPTPRCSRDAGAPTVASWSTPGRWTRRTSPPWRGPPAGWLLVLLTHGHPDHAEGAHPFAGDDRRADGRGRPAARASGPTPLVPGATFSGVGGLDAPGASAPRATRRTRCASSSWPTQPGLLTGDTVLGRGTHRRRPPRRAARDYLDLAGAAARPARAGGRCCPGTARPRADARRWPTAYLAHRAQRLDQVRAALAAGDRSRRRTSYAGSTPTSTRRSGRPPSSPSGPSSTTSRPPTG